MPQNTIAMILFHFCTQVKYKMQITQ